MSASADPSAVRPAEGSGLQIPRIIHRIWIGGEPMPEVFQAYGESWRTHHPEWEMRLWTEDNLPQLEAPADFHRGRNQSERSNVLRYDVLRQFGGIYVDTDMECLRPIEPLLDGVSVFAGYQREGRLGSAIIGSVAHHPAFEALVERVRGRTGEGNQTNQNGPGFLAEVLAEHSDVTYFDVETFYPYSHLELYRAGEEFPDSFSVHRWSKTWESREELQEKVARLQRRLDRYKGRVRKAERRADVLEARLEAVESGAWQRLGRRAAGVLPASVRRRVQPPPQLDR